MYVVRFIFLYQVNAHESSLLHGERNVCLPLLKEARMSNEECAYKRPNLLGKVEVPTVPLQFLSLTKLTKTVFEQTRQ